MKKKPQWSMEFSDDATLIEVRLPPRSARSRETIITTRITKGPARRVAIKKRKRR